jgi:SAM-dependent methyltransferase
VSRVIERDIGPGERLTLGDLGFPGILQHLIGPLVLAGPLHAPQAATCGSGTQELHPKTHQSAWSSARERETRWHPYRMGAAHEMVRAGYNAMAEEYGDWVSRIVGDPRARFLDLLESHLDLGSRVVDLGCGQGVPSTKALAERHDVLGIDISDEQIRRARRNVPSATFQRANFAEVDLPCSSVDAVTAFYSLTHVPREEHAALFRKISRWLRPGGYLLATLSGHGETDGTQDEFIGVPMYFSGFSPQANRVLLNGAGFDLLIDEVIEMTEPEGPSSFQWLLATKTP